MPELITNNLLGIVENATLTPMVAYRIDEDGHPYVPLGDGGIVLGVGLGDPVFATVGDHVAAGVSLVHPDPGARFALTAFACVGNEAVVLSGAAAGRRGRVIGKRGESGRVLVGFDDDVMRALLPGDRVSVRSVGQGFQPLGVDPAIEVLSLDPALYDLLPITTDDGITSVTTVTTLPSRVCGNGIGRPAQMWDVDLAVSEGSPLLEGVDLRLGDLVAISDLDVRHNMGFRRGWLTVGVIGHGGSPMPGHGPGLVPLITGPSNALRAVAADPGSPRPALTDALLAALDGRDA